jgi:S-DNA-T family DNA segregation ATPase FtsK/SpoIIIE
MTTQPLQFQAENVQLTTRITIPLWIAYKAWRATRILAPSPAVWIITALVALEVAVGQLSWLLTISLTLACLVALGFWRMQFPASFTVHIAGRTRGTVRSLFWYRWRWSRALRRSGVISNIGGLPLLVRTWSTSNYDRLTIRMVAGQQPTDFSEEADRLAQSFGALACRVHTMPNRPHWVQLMFMTNDPLTKTLGPYPPELDWITGLPIAIREDGQPWKLQLVGSHLLLVGATGAGKSSVIWAIIDQLIPAINDRTVRLWVLDPKGGMELAAGQAHFNRFVYGSDPTQYAIMLEQAVRVMQRRQADLRGSTRQHQPSTTEPLIVIIIDELAALTAWAADIRPRIHNALGLLLSQGRAVGVTVVGAVQDPRKVIIPMRGLFTTRIELRVTEADEVRMVLGAAALNAGAKAHEIPKSLPGVGYVTVDGDPDPYRVRFAHVTDGMIKDFRAPEPEQQTEQAEPELEPSTKYGGFA